MKCSKRTTSHNNGDKCWGSYSISTAPALLLRTIVTINRSIVISVATLGLPIATPHQSDRLLTDLTNHPTNQPEIAGAGLKLVYLCFVFPLHTKPTIQYRLLMLPGSTMFAEMNGSSFSGDQPAAAAAAVSSSLSRHQQPAATRKWLQHHVEILTKLTISLSDGRAPSQLWCGYRFDDLLGFGLAHR